MQMKGHCRWAMASVLAVLVPALLPGCQTPPPAVIAVTGTNFGLEISQNAATQTPQIKLGYNRGEVALVSKDKFKDNDLGNVLMEFNYGGTTSNNIYQRLAVGENAVQQAGAAAMFLKDANGTLSPAAAAMIEKELIKIPTAGQSKTGIQKSGDKK